MSKLQAKNSTSAKKFLCTANTNPSTGEVSNLQCTEIPVEEISPKRIVKAAQPKLKVKAAIRHRVTATTRGGRCLEQVKECQKIRECFPCIELERPTPAPPSQDVYDQHFLLGGLDRVLFRPVMEEIFEVSHSLSQRLPGVFGYLPDGTFSLDGGDLYEPHVESVDFIVHGPDLSQVADIAVTDMVAVTELTARWFTERGFQLAPPDTYEQNADHYNFRSDPAGDIQAPPVWVIDIAFHYADEEASTPSHLDLVALSQDQWQPDPDINTAMANAAKGIAPFEDDLENNRDQRFAYPLRIPIVTDCRDFNRQTKRNRPVAYYDNITQQITIDVRNQNFLSFLNEAFPSQFPPPEYSRWEHRMHGFSGKFQLTKRDNSNQLIPTNFAGATLLLQTSEEIIVKTSNFIGARGDTAPLDRSYVVNYRNEQGQYSGVVAPLVNGGSDAFDIYLIQPGFTNATSRQIESFITWSSTRGDRDYAIGDNSNTILKEYLGTPTSYLLFDTNDWLLDDVLLTVEFFANPPLPEDVASFPPALPTTPFAVLASTNNHEYLHSVQQGLGLYPSIDAEAQATGVELDPSINQGDYFTGRTRSWARFIVLHSRGKWPLLKTDSEFAGFFNTFTYGQGIWWQWLAKLYDENYQVMRRTNDIMATVWGPLHVQIVPLLQTGLFYGGANRLSVQQALEDLNLPSLSELYRDFAISTALLRNNGSIPIEYRAQFPFWMAQPAYPDAGTVTFFAHQPVRHWWHEFDTNLVPSPASRFAVSPAVDPDARFNSFQIPLMVGPAFELEFEDLTSYIYFVNRANVDTVVVQSTLGRIIVTMLQFTPNVPDINGTFEIEGPTGKPIELEIGESHSFTVANFDGAGLIRLVISNVSVTDFGGINNLLLNSAIDRITGRATVTAS